MLSESHRFTEVNFPDFQLLDISSVMAAIQNIPNKIYFCDSIFTHFPKESLFSWLHSSSIFLTAVSQKAFFLFAGRRLVLDWSWNEAAHPFMIHFINRWPWLLSLPSYWKRLSLFNCGLQFTTTNSCLAINLPIAQAVQEKPHSWKSCLISLLPWTRAMCLLSLLDLTAAFDSVDTKLFFSFCNHLSVTLVSLWIGWDIFSAPEHLSDSPALMLFFFPSFCGVPQGFVFGLFCFPFMLVTFLWLCWFSFFLCPSFCWWHPNLSFFSSLWCKWNP